MQGRAAAINCGCSARQQAQSSCSQLGSRGKNLSRCVRNREILHFPRKTAKFCVYRDKPRNFAFTATNRDMFAFSAIDRDYLFFSIPVNWAGTLIRGRVDQSLQKLTSRYKN